MNMLALLVRMHSLNLLKVSRGGVVLEKKAMGQGTKPKVPLIIEIDKQNDKKDLEKLEIEIPILQARIQRNYKNLSDLKPSEFEFTHPVLR